MNMPILLELRSMRTSSLYYALVWKTSDLIKLWKLCSAERARISCMFVQSPRKEHTLLVESTAIVYQLYIKLREQHVVEWSHLPRSLSYTLYFKCN
jgi:hypothetical protein